MQEPERKDSQRSAASSDPVSEVIERIFQLAQQKVRSSPDAFYLTIYHQNTSEVKLNGRPLQKIHVKLISKLLIQYSLINSLELRSASLDDACLGVFTKFLKKNRFCALTSLDVSENRFKV